MGKVRYNIEYKDNETPFTIVYVRTQVALYKTIRGLNDIEWPGKEKYGMHMWVCDGKLTDEEKTALKDAFPRSQFEFEEATPPVVAHVYRVAYAHKTMMRQLGFLKKEEPEDKDEKPQWYYLVPYEISSERVKQRLELSAASKYR